MVVETPAFLARGPISWTRRVQSLYKRAVRNAICTTDPKELDPMKFLVVWPEIRARFEKNRHVKDMRVAKMLLEQGERELFLNLTEFPYLFPYSPGGVCYERFPAQPDDLLDSWDPLEKAMYSYFFARREKLKKEYIELYEKTYGPPPSLNEDH